MKRKKLEINAPVVIILILIIAFIATEINTNITGKAVVDTSNIEETSYVYGNGLVASIDKEGLKYHHNDYLGSPTVITDSSGNKISEQKYDVFGANLKPEISTLEFTGKEKDDDTGLHYFGARYYDSNIGRFTSADTIKGKITNPQSLNLYAYTLNNPLKYVDPSGNRVKFVQTHNELNNAVPKLLTGINALFGYERVEMKDNFLVIKESNVFVELFRFHSLPQKMLYSLLKGTININRVISVTLSEQQKSHTTTEEIDIKDYKQGFPRADIFLNPKPYQAPLGDKGTPINFNIITIFIHELAHARGFINHYYSYSESNSVFYENLVRNILGEKERVFYAQIETVQNNKKVWGLVKPKVWDSSIDFKPSDFEAFVRYDE